LVIAIDFLEKITFTCAKNYCCCFMEWEKIFILLEKIGRWTEQEIIQKPLTLLGKWTIFLGNVFHSLAGDRWNFTNCGEQLLQVGFFSLPVVAMTALFTGGVMALQTYAGCNRFGAESTVPTIVALAITRELAPILVGLMVAGRVSSSMASQISTMKITNQLDALHMMSVNPFSYLVTPRIFATSITLPLSVLVADIIGILGGTLASVFSLKFDLILYLHNTIAFLHPVDVYSGLLKAVVFGLLIAICGCYNGYNASDGAIGVGKATINAVISASITILITNYMMTKLFFV
jgi:phospholipid/cholesterol/gamma-HCH transport system permease protein